MATNKKQKERLQRSALRLGGSRRKNRKSSGSITPAPIAIDNRPEAVDPLAIIPKEGVSRLQMIQARLNPRTRQASRRAKEFNANRKSAAASRGAGRKLSVGGRNRKLRIGGIS